jgi:hypothetical protein
VLRKLETLRVLRHHLRGTKLLQRFDLAVTTRLSGHVTYMPTSSRGNSSNLIRSTNVETNFFQDTQQTIERNNNSAHVQALNEVLGDSDEFALLRETLWIYLQVVDSK